MDPDILQINMGTMIYTEHKAGLGSIVTLDEAGPCHSRLHTHVAPPDEQVSRSERVTMHSKKDVHWYLELGPG
jgi:hypothetical protein